MGKIAFKFGILRDDSSKINIHYQRASCGQLKETNPRWFYQIICRIPYLPSGYTAGTIEWPVQYMTHLL